MTEAVLQRRIARVFLVIGSALPSLSAIPHRPLRAER